jgi:hypothetical protein
MISDNITAKAAAILKEVQDFNDGIITSTPIATEVADKSKQAILHGRPSEAWTSYMSLFSTSDEELARLIPTDGTDSDPVMEKARAYLVANGICSMGTGTNLPNNVGNKFDKG